MKQAKCLSIDVNNEEILNPIVGIKAIEPHGRILDTSFIRRESDTASKMFRNQYATKTKLTEQKKPE